MRNQLIDYKYDVLSTSSNNYILVYNKKYYKIEELLYIILKCGQKVETIEELYDLIGMKKSFSKTNLIKLIDEKVVPLFTSIQDPPQEKRDNFWIRKRLLKEEIVEKIAKPFGFLFGGTFYFFFFILLALYLFLIFNFDRELLSLRNASTSFTVFKWVISYLSLFILIFFHEIGHAAAAVKLGIKPRSIGIGFYTVFPVMYTDLTEAWKLKKRDKIKVNMGGLYMNLLIGIILSIFIHLSLSIPIKEVLIYLVTINSFMIVINLFPLLKFDGYWILADLIDTPNLIQESNKKLLSLVVKKGPFDEEAKIPQKKYQKIVITIFSILRIFFIISLFFVIFVFVTFSIIKTYHFISLLPSMKFNITTLIEGGKRVFILLIISILYGKYIKMARSYILNNIIKWK